MRDQYLLILTRHVVPKSIGKDGDKKTQWIFGPKCDDDRFSGCDMTGKRWGCRVVLDGRAVCSMRWVCNNVTTTDSRAVTRPAKGEAAVLRWMVRRNVPRVWLYMASKLY